MSKNHDAFLNFKVLTYNTGLLRINLPFYTFEFTQYLEERLSTIPKEITTLNPDIVALQEVFLSEHKNILISKLKKIYPFYYSNFSKRLLWLGDGLLLLSKFPITNSYYSHFKKAPFLEKILVKKGFTKSTIIMPNKLKLGIINTHTTAGGLFHKPESLKAENYRFSEQEEIKYAVTNDKSLPYIILGDFNCSPSVSAINFKHLLNQGWVSTYDSLHSKNKTLLDENKYPTWEIENPLNTSSPHSESPNQRIDHIFMSRKANEIYDVVDSTIVLRNPIVHIDCPNNKSNHTPKITPSDHYGILTEFYSTLENH